MSQGTPLNPAGLSPERRKAFAKLLQSRGIGTLPAQEIPRRKERDEFPVSFAQQRLWLLDRLEPGSPRYNVFITLILNGKLDVGSFQRALGEVIRRHEILRARLADVGGEPVQRIAPAEAVSLPVVDLTDLPERSRPDEVRRLALEAAQRPYDLTEGPLYRFSIVRTAPERHAFLLGLHHVVSDAWSVGVLLQELTVSYSAYREGKTPPLPELPIQYADYAAWQRTWLQGQVVEKQLSYWRQKLEGLRPLSLPIDRPRPSVQGFSGATLSRSMGKDLAVALKTLSQREGVTPFMTMLAAFQTLLFRYTGDTDIAVGSPIANRSRAQLEGLIGLFVNTLVLRTDLSGDPSFRRLLGRVRDVTVGAFTHQDLPFEKLVGELAPERDLSRNPLFQVSFVLHQGGAPTRFSDELRLEADAVDNGVAKFDLTLYVTEEEGGLSASLEYSTDLFERATVESMLDHFQVLLEGIARDPDSRLSALPLCTREQLRQAIEDGNETDRPFPAEATLPELFAGQVDRTPEADALVFGEERMTYRELDRRASAVAQRLRALGVGPETVVGLFAERSPAMATGLLGILKAGGAYVPLDPSYPPARLAFMLEDAGVGIVATTSSLLGRVPAGWERTLCLDSDELDGTTGGEKPAREAVAQNLAYVIYTSGSTGRPKGVMIPHRGLVNYLTWAADAYAVGSGRSLVHSPLGFDLTITSLVLPLLTGGTVELLPEGELDVLADRLSRGDDLGLLKITPAHLKALGAALPSGGGGRWARLLVVGGEALRGEDLEAVRVESPESWIVNEYGPTETVVGCCVHRLQARDAEAGPLPIGAPIGNTRLYVVDEALMPVPPGVPGELLVGGEGVGRGYRGRPDLTAERFVPDSFGRVPGARLYCTGDRVRYRPGKGLEYLGRIDEQIKLRGYRIEAGEIEAVLAENAAVRQSVVVVREDRRGDRRLVAYVVLDGPLSVSEMRTTLLARLPPYMVPAAFVTLPVLPLTPNGKVDRHALPAPDAEAQEGEFVAPRTPVERVVAAAFAQVLGRNGLGVNDSFFSLGGHSLLATQVVSRLRDSFRAEVPLRLLFESPTVAGLAAALESDPERGPRFGRIAEVLLQVAQLSENETEKMLAERNQ